MRIIKLLFIASAFLSSTLLAQTKPSPDVLLESVADSLFADIAKVNSKGDASKSDMSDIVKQRLMPHIDVKFVSFKLLGKHIKGIERAQAVNFIDAVEHYLVGTYADALMKYTGQKVVFEHNNVNGDADYATVNTKIIQPNAPAIALSFKLRMGKDNEWKVYDIVAEGISLLSAKQKEIIQRISDVGLEQVTNELKSK